MDFIMQQNKLTSSCKINMTETEPKEVSKPSLNTKPILTRLIQAEDLSKMSKVKPDQPTYVTMTRRSNFWSRKLLEGVQ